jgi:hypothetical protein
VIINGSMFLLLNRTEMSGAVGRGAKEEKIEKEKI